MSQESPAVSKTNAIQTNLIQSHYLTAPAKLCGRRGGQKKNVKKKTIHDVRCAEPVYV